MGACTHVEKKTFYIETLCRTVCRSVGYTRLKDSRIGIDHANDFSLTLGQPGHQRRFRRPTGGDPDHDPPNLRTRLVICLAKSEGGGGGGVGYAVWTPFYFTFEASGYAAILLYYTQPYI